jgi:hypothetical protein
MKCQKCFKEFEDKDIQESHDVPKYMFNGDKNEADKHGRHNLCIKCHDVYEKLAFSVSFNILDELQKEICRNSVELFAKKYFKDGEK